MYYIADLFNALFFIVHISIARAHSSYCVSLSKMRGVLKVNTMKSNHQQEIYVFFVSLSTVMQYLHAS